MSDIQPEPNVINRKKMLEDALSETYNLDQLIAKAMEKYIKPYRANKRDIKAKLREDLNVTPVVFNARYAAYVVEGRARAANDEATLDTLRELFEHSPVGVQVDMVDALEDG